MNKRSTRKTRSLPLQLLTLLCFTFALVFPAPLFADDGAAEKEPTTLERVNSALASVIFYDISAGRFSVPKVTREGEPVLNEAGEQEILPVDFPIVVAVLAFGAIFFTFFYGWINIRGFTHAVQIVRGRFDKEHDDGEISHFKALTSALSATVGLGNIAGVALVIQVGGPGAVFWMLFLGVFGMCSKFHSCTLAQMYRQTNPDGSISGGPMYYLDIGLKRMGPVMGAVGKVLAVIFAVMVMGGSLGGGNMFQANQTVEAMTSTFALPEYAPKVIGVVMAILVAIVILGGIKRIGNATSRIVPFMCALYVIASVIVLVVNIHRIPEALYLIVKYAFTDNAFFGGIVGVLYWGFRRAAFSNEAGLGSAAIAHAAAKTKEPVREGFVAMLEPFIDTLVICLMTALVIIVTGTWEDPALVDATGNTGVTLTTEAFRTVLPWFPYVLTICIALFAYSTMISWCYYGERGWIYLLDHFGKGVGSKTLPIFRVVFVCFVYIGATHKLGSVLDFSDLMILSMAFPNIVGGIILAQVEG